MRDPRRAGARLRALASLLVLLLLAAGLPAALEAVGGSPIPRRLPSWHQVIASLARPDNGTLFVGALRWVSWLAWAMFALSALADAAARLRHAPAWRLPLAGPVQGLASALVGSVFLGLLPGEFLMPSAGAVPSSAVTAAAAQVRAGTPGRALAGPGQVPRASAGLACTGARPSSRRRRYVVVEGDSLWEIAARFLGDGERWAEIFAINQGVPQPGGHRLTNPDLIYPGWVLALPPPPARVTQPRHRSPVPVPPAQGGRARARHPATGSRPGTGPKTGRPAAPGRPRAPHPVHHPIGHPPQRPVGVRLPDGGLVGITLAAAISTALVAWRLHKRRAGVPRWPAPARPVPRDVPAAIRALRRAHLRSLAADTAEAHGESWADPASMAPWSDADDDEGLDEFGAPAAGDARQATAQPPGDDLGRPAGGVTELLPPIPAPTPVAGAGRRVASMPDGEPGLRSGPPGRPLPPGTVVFGIRGSEEIPLAEVARPDLGLTGPGACAAARAMMIGVLAASRAPAGRHAQVIIPAADARLLTGRRRGAAQIPGVTPGWPDTLTVTASLAGALDLVTAETARRRDRGPGNEAVTSASRAGTGASEPGQLVLIATADPLNSPRIRAVLDAGAGAGITGILLGDPAASVSCHVGADGTILAATQPWLSGVWVAHLSAADAVAMLSLLRGAEGHLIPEPPATGSWSADRPSTGSGHGLGDPSGLGAASDPAPAQAAAGDLAGLGRAGRPRAPGGRAQPAEPAWPANLPADVPLTPSGSEPGPLTLPGAGEPSTAAPPAPSVPVALSVLGPLRISAGGSELTGGLRKARELLACLAVHPDGATGERISADLWPDLSPRYAASQRKLALRKAREMLRTATGLPAAMFIVRAGDRYRLDPALISVDLQQFDAALDRATAARSDEEELAALRQAAVLYRGPLADGAGYEWAEYHAEPARRRAVDALARTAAILQPRQPEDALRVLETAITHDPYNEAVYQAVMRTQVRLGRADAARRTLALLETRLDALGLAPAPASREAAGIPGGEHAGPAPGDDRSGTTAKAGSRTARATGGPRPPQGRHRR